MDICIPTEAVLCKDMKCDNAMHSKDLNSYSNNITGACISAAYSTITIACNRQKSKIVPGWSEEVKPLRDIVKSLFWHWMWVDSRRPRTGAVADTMRRTRVAYRYAVRAVKKNDDMITRQRFHKTRQIMEEQENQFTGENKAL